MPHAPVTLKVYINEAILKRHFKLLKQRPWQSEIVRSLVLGEGKCRGGLVFPEEISHGYNNIFQSEAEAQKMPIGEAEAQMMLTGAVWDHTLTRTA